MFKIKKIKTLKRLIRYRLNRISNARRVKGLRSREKIRVGFFVLNRSMWKCDSVFKAMLKDEYFEPVILICPCTKEGTKKMLNDIEENVKFFSGKGYPVVSSYNRKTGDWVAVDSLALDLIFFAIPHPDTLAEYYSKAFRKHLSVYVPYAHQVSKYDNYTFQYNQVFHNMMWKIFAPHKYDLEIFKTHGAIQGTNVVLTGYPAIEPFIDGSKVANDPWKNQPDRKVRIIFAPHHTICSPKLPYSTFLEFSEHMKFLAEKNQKKVQWAFKPHPHLKKNLYKHKEWGRQKTDAYFDFWASSSFSQLEEGNYYDLFKCSDAMIHDSGSFLAEYLYLQKPVMYLAKSDRVMSFQNKFGNKAFNDCIIGRSKEDITSFIENLLTSKVEIKTTFFDNELKPYFEGSLPSQKIVWEIKNCITG